MEKVEGQFVGEVVGVIVEALNGDQLAGVAASIARTGVHGDVLHGEFLVADLSVPDVFPGLVPCGLELAVGGDRGWLPAVPMRS